MPELDVFVHGRFAGSITEGSRRQATFEYDDACLRGLRTPLSLNIPPSRRPHEVGMWIDGLLPDNARVREVWATRNNALSPKPIDLLATEIGADCAGAVQFFPAGAGIPQRDSGVQALTDRDIADWIRQARRDWSTWGGEGNLGQFSLGGAQAKCALHFDGHRWGLPHGDTPTTHILKPGLHDCPDAEIVEHVCMAAARHLGLEAAETELAHFQDERVVTVTRFDVKCRFGLRTCDASSSATGDPLPSHSRPQRIKPQSEPCCATPRQPQAAADDGSFTSRARCTQEAQEVERSSAADHQSLHQNRGDSE